MTLKIQNLRVRYLTDGEPCFFCKSFKELALNQKIFVEKFSEMSYR